MESWLLSVLVQRGQRMFRMPLQQHMPLLLPVSDAGALSQALCFMGCQIAGTWLLGVLKYCLLVCV